LPEDHNVNTFQLLRGRWTKPAVTSKSQIA